MEEKERCFFCGEELKLKEFYPINGITGYKISCSICGNYYIDVLLDAQLSETKIDVSENQKSILRYFLKKHSCFYNDWFQITKKWINDILKNKSLPNIIEQTENLILYCGNTFKQGEYFERNKELVSIVGSESIKALDVIIGALLERNLLKQAYGKINIYSLTFGGWVEYEKLKRGQTSSNKAFLAMKFNSKFITDDLISKIKKSLEEIGYQLESLQDKQKAGLIDDHLRQRIKSSKFLIVDLSDANNGAYWEGGYGEGLGKPVIYICDNNKFKEQIAHFDTNHLLTLPYDTNCEDKNSEIYIDNFLVRLQNVIKESL